MTLTQYLTEISAADKQQLIRQLNITTIDQFTVESAAHRLYWGQLWPAKLQITGDNNKKLLENTTYTGLSLVDCVNALSPALVLDVGCGQNFYKNKIKNLVGIDIFGNDCDIQLDYFNSNYDIKADVILVLGVLEYGSPDLVIQKLQRIKQNCHNDTTVFFRFNVALRFGHEITPGKDICFFMNKVNHSPDQWNQVVTQAGFNVVFSDWDTVNLRWHIRAKI
jgi:hypothetical protein